VLIYQGFISPFSSLGLKTLISCLLRPFGCIILISCEKSGNAFSLKGHDASSIDVLPSDMAGKHYDIADQWGNKKKIKKFNKKCRKLTSK
jgi:hypothetical protein